MSTGNGGEELVPKRGQLSVPDNKMSVSWYGLSASAAFNELKSNDGTSRNQMCVVKADEKLDYHIIILGVEVQPVQLGGGKNQFVDTEVLVGRYAREEWYNRDPLQLQAYEIYREYPANASINAEWRRGKVLAERAFSQKLRTLWLANKYATSTPVRVTAQRSGLGTVGYQFKKRFPGHGWFVGKVVEIRPDAKNAKIFRCVYEEDGDLEDLSLAELRRFKKYTVG